MPKQKKKKAARVSVRQTSPYMVNNAPFGSNQQRPMQSSAPLLPNQPVALTVPLSSLAVSGGLEGEADYLRDMRARTMTKEMAECAADFRKCPGVAASNREEYEKAMKTKMGDPCESDPNLIGLPECAGKTVRWYDPNEKRTKIVKERPCDPATTDCTDRITNFDSEEQWAKRGAACKAAQTADCIARGMSAEQCSAIGPGSNCNDKAYLSKYSGSGSWGFKD